MGSFIDLTNQKFNNLLVIQRSTKKNPKTKSIMWQCRCDCGNIVDVSSNALRTGRTKSCGCLYKKNAEKRKINIIGRKFNKLTVLEEDYIKPYDNGKHHLYYYKCRCDCGNIVSVDKGSLMYNRVKSCGCYNVECHSKKNYYDFYDDLCFVWDEERTKVFIIDKEDYVKINKYYWSLDELGYPRMASKNENGKRLRVHQLIMGDNADHINRKPFDNRKENLRLIGLRGQGVNRGIPKNNTSGYKGVQKKGNYWIARISDSSYHRISKQFKTKEEAIIQRKAWETKYYSGLLKSNINK